MHVIECIRKYTSRLHRVMQRRKTRSKRLCLHKPSRTGLWWKNNWDCLASEVAWKMACLETHFYAWQMNWGLICDLTHDHQIEELWVPGKRSHWWVLLVLYSTPRGFLRELRFTLSSKTSIWLDLTWFVLIANFSLQCPQSVPQR